MRMTAVASFALGSIKQPVAQATKREDVRGIMLPQMETKTSPWQFREFSDDAPIRLSLGKILVRNGFKVWRDGEARTAVGRAVGLIRR